MQLTVGEEALNEVRIAVDSGAEVSGHFTQPVAGFVRFSDGDETEAARVHDDQTFSLTLPRGPHRIVRHLRGNEGWLITGVKSEGREIPDEGLLIEGPGRVNLEVTVTKDGGGKLEGGVADKDGAPVPGATVVLVPEPSRRSDPDLFLSSEADQTGHYQFALIPPGKYKLFAWTEIEEGLWWDEDFMRRAEPQGTDVVIEAGKALTQNVIVQ